MEFSQAVASSLRKYVVFSGRACRSEYWWFTLATMLINIAVRILLVVVSFVATPLTLIVSLIGVVIGLGLFLPSLSVCVRRLHDKDKSGWWLLLGLIPLIGAIVLLVWFCQRGTIGPNRFGPDPLAPVSPDAPTDAPTSGPSAPQSPLSGPSVSGPAEPASPVTRA